MRTKLEDAEIRAEISRAVKPVLLEPRRSAKELKGALKMACGKVARILLDSEKLPPQVSPFFLNDCFDQPERGASYALVGFMCPAHEDNVGFSGESGNRTIKLHRLIESAVASQGHDRAVCVNTNAVRCLKSGDGSHANPFARDENVDSVSQLLRAMYFAGLHAYGVKITRIVQCRARSGEKGPRLSSAGRVVFDSVRAGTTEAAFRVCPEDIGPPTPSSGSAASEQAVTNLRSMLEASLCGSLAAAKNANDARFRHVVPDRDGVKHSGVAGGLASGVAIVDTWAPDVCDSGRLIERGPGPRDQRVAHSLHMNSFLLVWAHGGASSPLGKATRPSRDDLLGDKQARRRLGKPPLLLDRQGVTDGGGKEQTGYRMPSKRVEAVGRAVCKATLKAAVSKGGVRVMVSTNGAGGVGTPDLLLEMFREDRWDDKEVSVDCRRLFLGRYGCSFGIGDTVGSAATANMVYPPDHTAGSSFLLYSTGGQASYIACAEMGLLKMGQVAGVSGAGEDAIFLHFLGRFCGLELFLAALASRDGQSVKFAERLHRALVAHGAVGVVRCLKGSAGADTGYVLNGELVHRNTPGAQRMTKGAAALKGLKATADLSAKTLARPAHQRTVKSGRVPLCGNVNKTAAERGKDKFTNEGKADAVEAV
ncbi:unnamed protein product [Ectocarpus sp. CCAP 1310/34]|nr:unnamed protein product [Ectocarpus sp. CCAP 1310/34]